MQKKRISLLLMMVLLSTTTGCASSLSETEAKETKKLEPYIEEEQKPDAKAEEPESPYQYLCTVRLEDEKVSVSTYLPNGTDFKQNGAEASASLHGISVALSTVQETPEKGAGSYIEELYKEEMEFIKGRDGVQDLKVFDLIEGEDYWMLEMDYTLNDNQGNLYPCMSIIKLDKLDDSFLLRYIIRVDNSHADEKTSAMLTEMMEVYGFKLSASK